MLSVYPAFEKHNDCIIATVGANHPKPCTLNDCTEQAEWRGLRFYVYSIEYAYTSVLTRKAFGMKSVYCEHQKQNKRRMKAVWFKTNDSRITTEAFGTEEELMGWLEFNSIAIIEKTHKYDSFGCGYDDMRLSIPCKGMDYDRAAAIKSAITNTLTNLGCDNSNIENLLDSFNFRNEFIVYECKDRDIVADYIHVCISTRDDLECPDNRLSLANLLNNHIWAIFNESCSFYQR